MISIKRDLDASEVEPEICPQPELLRARSVSPEKDKGGILAIALAAYRSALADMGNCSQEACPALGQELKQCLEKLADGLPPDPSREAVETAQGRVQERLLDWGHRTAAHYREKTAEVKELLIVMAQTAESVGERDKRCAGQISEVTTRLKTIASLEDLTEIRASIERSAADLKTSVDRMTEEGKRSIAQLKAEVSSYQVKLEEAEELASRDALTGLRNRSWLEKLLERRIHEGAPISVAIVDIDDFKKVNDEYGHLAGDELLKQFAGELKSASRKGDVIGRWGGDEFILMLECDPATSETQIERLRVWVCGNYTVQGARGTIKVKVEASIGLAGHAPGETLKGLLARADAAMYARKADARKQGNGLRR